ncbi:MAG: hypothetical protein M3P49_00910, partial [Actinomycetota bacterium]|nr:hypothetical protein [Actinomycetota bacterium]
MNRCLSAPRPRLGAALSMTGAMLVALVALAAGDAGAQDAGERYPRPGAAQTSPAGCAEIGRVELRESAETEANPESSDPPPGSTEITTSGPVRLEV